MRVRYYLHLTVAFIVGAVVGAVSFFIYILIDLVQGEQGGGSG